jgi:hypothetical protein
MRRSIANQSHFRPSQDQIVTTLASPDGFRSCSMWLHRFSTLRPTVPRSLEKLTRGNDLINPWTSGKIDVCHDTSLKIIVLSNGDLHSVQNEANLRK